MKNVIKNNLSCIYYDIIEIEKEYINDNKHTFKHAVIFTYSRIPNTGIQYDHLWLVFNMRFFYYFRIYFIILLKCMHIIINYTLIEFRWYHEIITIFNNISWICDKIFILTFSIIHAFFTVNSSFLFIFCLLVIPLVIQTFFSTSVLPISFIPLSSSYINHWLSNLI